MRRHLCGWNMCKFQPGSVLLRLYRVHARVNLNVLIAGVAIHVREKYFEILARE